MKTLVQLRAAITAAGARWDEALAAFEHSTQSNMASTEAELNRAKDAYEEAVRAYDHRDAFDAAKRALPALINDNGGESRGGYAGSLRVTETELTYEQPRHRDAPTFFRDMAHAEHHGDSAARERLERHGRQMVDQNNPRVGARALNITDGTGGQFV